jgi:hypothetical protein
MSHLSRSGLSANSLAPVPAPSIPDPSPRIVDWELAKRVLATLHKEAPVILAQAVIIGGVSCWFYRQALAKAADPDFKVPDLSPSQNKLWLSKDLDFTNFFAEDARRMLPNRVVRDAQGRQQLVFEGVPIGFAQVGITFDPESAFIDSWIGRFADGEALIEFRVLDPVALYREKLALSQRRGAEADLIHCSLMAEFLRFETCQQASSLTSAKTLAHKSNPMKFLTAIRDRAPEICRDNRLHDRVRQCALAASLTPAEVELLRQLLASLE